MTAAKKTIGKPASGPSSDKPFVFKCDNGVTIKLPSLATLDPDLDVLDDIADDLKSDNPLISLPANRRFLLSALPESKAEQLGNVKRMSEFQRLLEAWSKHSGVTPGESAAS